jgi:hypothetical protein
LLLNYVLNGFNAIKIFGFIPLPCLVEAVEPAEPEVDAVAPEVGGGVAEEAMPSLSVSARMYCPPLELDRE